MITSTTHKIKILEIEAKKKAAFTSKDAVYDKEKNELTYVIENITGQNFCLVYGNKKCFALIENTDKTITSTLWATKEFSTKKQALKQIEELGLEYDFLESLDVNINRKRVNI